jgi:hypothetical protein
LIDYVWQTDSVSDEQTYSKEKRAFRYKNEQSALGGSFWVMLQSLYAGFETKERTRNHRLCFVVS